MEKLGINPNTVNFTVSILSANEIRELNRDFLGKDYATDVLSFPLLDIRQGQIPNRENFPLDYNPESGKIELGDIVVNESEPNHESLIEHGLMHLLGYHHDDDKEDE